MSVSSSTAPEPGEMNAEAEKMKTTASSLLARAEMATRLAYPLWRFHRNSPDALLKALHDIGSELEQGGSVSQKLLQNLSLAPSHRALPTMRNDVVAYERNVNTPASKHWRDKDTRFVPIPLLRLNPSERGVQHAGPVLHVAHGLVIDMSDIRSDAPNVVAGLQNLMVLCDQFVSEAREVSDVPEVKDVQKFYDVLSPLVISACSAVKKRSKLGTDLKGISEAVSELAIQARRLFLDQSNDFVADEEILDPSSAYIPPDCVHDLKCFAQKTPLPRNPYFGVAVAVGNNCFLPIGDKNVPSIAK